MKDITAYIGEAETSPSRMVKTVLAQLSTAAELMAGLEAMAGLTGGPVQYLVGLSEINDRIQEAVEGSRHEILTSQPHAQEGSYEESLNRDMAALTRGVAIRTLYPASARGSAGARKWVTQVSALGAQARTLGMPFMKGITVDRQAVFLEDCLERPGEDPSTVRCCMIRDPVVADWMGALFDTAWERARPWDAPQTSDVTITTCVQRSILRALCDGRSRESAASALDMSVRSVDSHLCKLRTEMGLASTYQLIAWWVASEERGVV